MVAASRAAPQLCPGLQASELWEVVEEARGRLGAEGIMPERQEGHLLKKRKWPLKGWHKVSWAGPGEEPDAGGWDVRGCGQHPPGVCMWGRNGRAVAPSPPFPLVFLVLFLLGHITEILCAGGRDPSLCHHTARCESGPQLGGVGGVWPQSALGRQGLLESSRAGSESQAGHLLGGRSWAVTFLGLSSSSLRWGECDHTFVESVSW